ncbi:D-isomer specific 2-hydroxyacid dehydrogenase, NAD-binding domain conserved site [Propionibacterium ruminifibrarum]|uniref:D-isomer specific 2-hydroxyacid dehydrogenase, NAD-binding domain conserved site n=2 Tax=Propionibacterium ruminifibrarum TaxID=1962131 RepID=A0A375I3L9_9ACTN|nr:D-isomer specific 2-hydroxyacid dehydrogenase, NAD-binding domain conserved site [Propionibacterium ruminifibrarum]
MGAPMARICITDAIPEAAVTTLRAAGHEVAVWDGDLPPGRSELLDLVAGADAVLTVLSDGVDEEFLDAAGPQLRIVANVAAGYNNIDLAACRARGVVVTNTPGVLFDATADIAFGLLLMVTRRLGEGERLIRAGRPWRYRTTFMLGHSIEGKTIGLIGAGQIGTAMARRCKAFGMTIAYADEHPMREPAAGELAATGMPLDELVAGCDVISLHCPLTEETRHILNAERIAAMRPGSYVINTARGACIDEEALAAALASGHLGGAGLDVYENEPQVHPALLGLENVVLLPHLGSATIETRTAMGDLAVENVLAVLAGRPAPSAV